MDYNHRSILRINTVIQINDFKHWIAVTLAVLFLSHVPYFGLLSVFKHCAQLMLFILILGMVFHICEVMIWMKSENGSVARNWCGLFQNRRICLKCCVRDTLNTITCFKQICIQDWTFQSIYWIHIDLWSVNIPISIIISKMCEM
jgi:hypothetical protein